MLSTLLPSLQFIDDEYSSRVVLFDETATVTDLQLQRSL